MYINREVTHCFGLIGLIAIAIWTGTCPEHLIGQLCQIISYHAAQMIVMSITFFTGAAIGVAIFWNPPPNHDLVATIPTAWVFTALLFSLLFALAKPFQPINLMPTASALILLPFAVWLERPLRD